MLDGLYSAASGMAAQQEQLDAIANDLGNISTPGYQSTRVGFRDLLYSSGGRSSGSPNISTGAGTAANLFGRSQIQGTIEQTGQPLDVALAGEGYIQVRRPDGTVGLTRNGVLEVNADGQLATNLGMPLEPPIRVPAGTPADQIKIGSDGTVTVGNRRYGQITVVTVPAPDKLLPDGDSVFSPTAASGAVQRAAGTTVQQGALEQSNVDIATAMTTMITAQQGYSLASKAVDMQNQMMQIANQIKK